MADRILHKEVRCNGEWKREHHHGQFYVNRSCAYLSVRVTSCDRQHSRVPQVPGVGPPADPAERQSSEQHLRAPSRNDCPPGDHEGGAGGRQDTDVSRICPRPREEPSRQEDASKPYPCHDGGGCLWNLLPLGYPHRQECSECKLPCPGKGRVVRTEVAHSACSYGRDERNNDDAAQPIDQSGTG